MPWLNRLLRSESPKLARPGRTAVGLVLQRTRWSERLRIQRDGYVLPFFASSNMALTYWAVPGRIDATEDIVKRLLGASDVFVDVGANVGTVTAVAALAVGPTGRVVAIEPHPSTFRNLERTVAVNGFTNVVCRQVACGAAAGSVLFSDERRKDDNNRVQTGAPSDRGRGPATVHVPSVPLGDVLRDLAVTRVDLLKVDVEGFELEVLRGMGPTLELVGLIHVEAIEHNLNGFGATVDSLVVFLTDHGFQCFGVADDPANLVAARPERLPALHASCGERIRPLDPGTRGDP